MKRQACILLVYLLALSGLTCGTAFGKGLKQGAYDICVNSYNQKFRALPTNKAMVVGWSGSDRRWQANCYWRWNAPSLDDAITGAIATCHKAGYPKCSVFATQAGLADWAGRISRNGGRDPDSRSYAGSSGNANAALNSFLSGFARGTAAWQYNQNLQRQYDRYLRENTRTQQGRKCGNGPAINDAKCGY